MSKPFLRGQFFKLILLQVWISDKRIQKRININEFIPSVWIRNSEIRETRLNAAPLVPSFSALSNQCLEETNKLSSLTSFYQVKANLWANEFWNRLVFSLIYIEVFRKTLSIQTNRLEKNTDLRAAVKFRVVFFFVGGIKGGSLTKKRSCYTSFACTKRSLRSTTAGERMPWSIEKGLC